MRSPFDHLPDPDAVGQSEYRLVYDFLKDLEDQGEDILLIQSSADEISKWARRALIECTRITNTY